MVPTMSRENESPEARIRRLKSNADRQARRNARLRETEEGRQLIRNIKNARNAKARRMVAAYKLEKGCIDCGYNTHPAALQLDHRDGEVKLNSVSRMQHTADKIAAEINKCDVRCANCHAVITHLRQVQRTGIDHMSDLISSVPL